MLPLYNPDLPLIVRYKSDEQTYVSKKLTSIPDKENTAKNINNLSEKDNIIKLAKVEINKEKAKNPKVIAGYLRDHNNQFGRVIIPAA